MRLSSMSPDDERASVATPRRRNENLRALIVALVIAIAGTLFVASYGIALGDPTPRNLPIGVVGDASFAQDVGAVFDAAGIGTFTTETFASTSDADDALTQQQVFAIVERGPGDELDVVVSSASGASVAQLIEQSRTTARECPRAPGDGDGRASARQERSAGPRPLLPRDGRDHHGLHRRRPDENQRNLTLGGEVGWDVIRSALAALCLTLIVGPVLGLDAVPILPTWLTLTVAMLVAAMFYNSARVTIGATWALLPRWILFVIVANPASGGAVPPELLPPFYEFMGRWLPTGATVYILRDITYFPTAVNPEPIIVMLAWLVAATTVFMLVRRRRYGSGVVGAAPASPLR